MWMCIIVPSGDQIETTINFSQGVTNNKSSFRVPFGAWLKNTHYKMQECGEQLARLQVNQMRWLEGRGIRRVSSHVFWGRFLRRMGMENGPMQIMQRQKSTMFARDALAFNSFIRFISRITIDWLESSINIKSHPPTQLIMHAMRHSLCFCVHSIPIIST